MRIIGGQARGRRLASFQGLTIRPTSDRVREAVFNLLGRNLTGLKVLDLFAGTGALGMESLSRGAEACVFVDKSLQAIKQIRKNLLVCRFQEQGLIIRHDLLKGLPEKRFLRWECFDLVFIDPPYEKGLSEHVLKELTGKRILCCNGRVVVESSKRDVLPDSWQGISMMKSRVYGDTRITLYQYEENA